MSTEENAWQNVVVRPAPDVKKEKASYKNLKFPNERKDSGRPQNKEQLEPSSLSSNKKSFNFFRKKPPKINSKIPILTNFIQNKDGSLTARIYNSKNFVDGDAITTSPIPITAKDGMLVTTATGSKYQLQASSSTVTLPKTPVQGSSFFSFGTQRIPGVKVESLPKQTASNIRSSATFSVNQNKKPIPPAFSPMIPTISNFRQNFDGSITGRVSNSVRFRNGAEITTSPVRKGAKAGVIVTTSSGTKYLLK